MQLTNDLIKQCLKEFRVQQRNKKKYLDYYNGESDIYRNYSFSEQRSNNKVATPYFPMFLTSEVSYALGNPINYLSVTGDQEIIDVIDLNFSSWSKAHDQNLLKNSGIYGESYELLYISSDNEFKATVLTPLNAYILESGDAEKEVVLALHVYKENKFSNNEKMDVYWQNKIYTYRLTTQDRMYFETERTTIFNKPPIIVNGYNHERKSMLDYIKSLIDGIDVLMSNGLNESNDLRLAFLKIINSTLDPEDAKRMKESGILEVKGKGADMQFLTKEIPSDFISLMLTKLEEKLYQASSHINVQEKLQSNVSGSALMSRLISVEFKVSLMQTMLELTIKKRLKNFFRFIEIRDGVKFNSNIVRCRFTANVPHDLSNIGDFISKTKDIIPHEDLLSLLPFIENPEHALQKFYNEQRMKRELEMEGQIDLENYGINPQALVGQGDLDE